MAFDFHTCLDSRRNSPKPMLTRRTCE
jgi:hypothetical protein